MNAITLHEAFTPEGSGAAPVAAVSAGAGCIWLHLYQAVTGGAGLYVQGGGCTTVGVAGLVQGGGFGQFSKAYGTAAASLLEAEIVTADGAIRTVNDVREPDLFWALKGGGGGTFGIVTRVTLATHLLPATFGALHVTIHSRSDEAYRRLLARFVDHYATDLFNPHWGERVSARPDNRLEVAMNFQGLSADEARAAWQPLIDFTNSNSADYEGQNSLVVQAAPARLFWNAEVYRRFAPSAVNLDDRSGASETDFWWRGDGNQVGAFWHAYIGLDARIVTRAGQPEPASGCLVCCQPPLARQLRVQQGPRRRARCCDRRGAEHRYEPHDVLDAFALVIIASYGAPTFPGFSAPDLAVAGARRALVRSSMAALRAVAPDTGAYVNECDYFQPYWQKAFWGSNYVRLLEIKQRYDPHGLFIVHHGVGSEAWSPDGFTKMP